MATIYKPELFKFESFDPAKIQGVRVGHNRTVSHYFDRGGNPVIEGALHGSPVFKLARIRGVDIVTLNPCGWLTMTTTRAMGDFGQAAGFKIRASMSGKTFSARIGGIEYDANGRGAITGSRARGVIKAQSSTRWPRLA